jgi:hypothetical protein
MYQLHLPRCGCRLQVFESCAPFVDPEYRAANGNRAGRHDQELMPLAVQHRNVIREPLEPAPMHVTIVTNQQ